MHHYTIVTIVIIMHYLNNVGYVPSAEMVIQVDQFTLGDTPESFTCRVSTTVKFSLVCTHAMPSASVMLISMHNRVSLAYTISCCEVALKTNPSVHMCVYNAQ